MGKDDLVKVPLHRIAYLFPAFTSGVNMVRMVLSDRPAEVLAAVQEYASGSGNGVSIWIECESIFGQAVCRQVRQKHLVKGMNPIRSMHILTCHVQLANEEPIAVVLSDQKNGVISLHVKFQHAIDFFPPVREEET